jgi:hypothetical protein
MTIDFRKATDELLATLSHEELAKALDSSVPSVRQARLDETAKAYRTAPEGWRRVISKLALQRAERLKRLAMALKRAEQSENAA